MIYIRATNEVINLITIEQISDATCTVSELPSDFYQSFWLGKYLANSDGVYLNPNWTDPENLYKYFLIPTDFVQYISHYSGWVKEVLLDLRFDIVCEQTEVVVEGNSIVMPTSVVSVIPCSVTYFNEEGLAILEAVIGSWNNQNANKIIGIPYTFERYTDLITFRNEHIQV